MQRRLHGPDSFSGHVESDVDAHSPAFAVQQIQRARQRRVEVRAPASGNAYVALAGEIGSPQLESPSTVFQRCPAIQQAASSVTRAIDGSFVDIALATQRRVAAGLPAGKQGPWLKLQGEIPAVARSPLCAVAIQI